MLLVCKQTKKCSSFSYSPLKSLGLRILLTSYNPGWRKKKSMFDIWCERENPKLTGNLLASVHIGSYSSISGCTWDLNKSPHAN